MVVSVKREDVSALGYLRGNHHCPGPSDEDPALFARSKIGRSRICACTGCPHGCRGARTVRSTGVSGTRSIRRLSRRIGLLAMRAKGARQPAENVMEHKAG